MFGTNSTTGVYKMIKQLNEDGYKSLTLDGYKFEQQINVKLTEQDIQDMKNINVEFFEGEASNSMLGRILIRKGLQFYKKLKTTI